MLNVQQGSCEYKIFQSFGLTQARNQKLNTGGAYYQSNHSKVEAIPFSALPKDTTSELAGLSPHYLFLC